MLGDMLKPQNNLLCGILSWYADWGVIAVKIIVCLITILSLPFNVWAGDSKESLACMAGASADIDGSKSYPTDASSVRFLLTLLRRDQKIIAVHVKHTGVMEGMPASWYQCSLNGAGNLYACANGAEVIWYFPSRKHGVIANLNVVSVLKENRANAAGIYNYSCTAF